MDKETRVMFELILNRLESMDSRFDGMESRFDRLETRLGEVETRLGGVEIRLDGVESRLDTMESRQEEMYRMLTSLEHNVKVTRAEQDKMSFILADIQGKVTKLINKVEDHDIVIQQIRAIK